MEELETGYDLEEPAEQEEEITEPEEEGPEQPEADQEETEPAGPDQEEDTETEDTEPEETEPEEEAEPDGNPEEEEPEDGASDTVTDAEEEPEEEPEESEQETVSGNDLVISGDVIIFPEDYDLSTLGGEREDAGSIVQAVEKQSDIMTAGFTCTCFMLGLLAGAVLIAGFRLRRV